MDKKEKIHIGTSGWSYKHWAGIYYPAGLKPVDYLSYYSKQFLTAEINTSFYRLPKDETIKNWVRQVPDNFVFCPKMSRFLSHMKKLHDAEEPVERFCSIFDDIKLKLGPILIQLPTNVHFHEELTEEFYRILKTKTDYRFAMEVRHESWYSDESIFLMKKFGITLVLAHSKDFPYLEAITAQDIYVRFHGPTGLYASFYDDGFLMDYAEKFKLWKSEGHNIWAYFNNDINGYALMNAQKMIELI
ncbi:DUF72 domain-containing protein [Dyadobacter sp. CY356]|uniref:DUF72 domain-containing protein n=1 Tax=Dyadobacter sp. CY356 TaxID=2906442 RepID=UPI001F294F1D|nr:DUF72 domain-containing protein [Dyadobacter sp. CY356]MCF0056930.1 DUF72 domain-containing protein [Dyadobacter sp. CY356]